MAACNGQQLFFRADSRLDHKYQLHEPEKIFESQQQLCQMWNCLLSDQQLICDLDCNLINCFALKAEKKHYRFYCCNTKICEGALDRNLTCIACQILDAQCERDEIEREKQCDGKSAADAFMKRWQNDDVADRDQLTQCIAALNVQQRQICFEAANSTLFATRLRQRMLILKRYLIALNRTTCKPIKLIAFNRGKMVDAAVVTTTESSAPTASPIETASINLARVGVRNMLNLSFSFLRRSWRSGDDTDLCSELLIDTIEALQLLPEATLFDKKDNTSLILVDVIDRTTKFLKDIVHNNQIPASDQHLALNLLLELSLQRGTLSGVLEIVLLLVSLSNTADSGRGGGDSALHDNRSTTRPNAPLISVLKRFQNIQVDAPENLNDVAKSPTVYSPCSCYLQLNPLPRDETLSVDLRHAAVFLMAHLDRVANAHIAPSSSAHSQNEKFMLLGKACWSQVSSMSSYICQLGVQQIVCSRTAFAFISREHKAYTIAFSEYAQCPEIVGVLKDKQVVEIATSANSRHYVALTADHDVYSWGKNTHGQLGHNDTTYRLQAQLIDALRNVKVIQVAVANETSACLTANGQLYLWGNVEQFVKNTTPTTTYTQPQLVDTLLVDCSIPCLLKFTLNAPNCAILGIQTNSKVFFWRAGSDSLMDTLNSDVNLTNVMDVTCGCDSYALITQNGRLFTWGFGGGYRLGHNTDDSLTYPKQVDALKHEYVCQVTIGNAFMLALTKDGNVYGWGNNSHGQLSISSKLQTITVPTVVTKISSTSVAAPMQNYMSAIVCASRNRAFVWSDNCRLVAPATLKYVADLTHNTFKLINNLLNVEVDQFPNEPSTPPKQEAECIIFATLNLLKLQLNVLATHNTDPSCVGLAPNSRLANALKTHIVQLASGNGVLKTIQYAAQDILCSNWKILLPTPHERTKTLNSMLSAAVDSTKIYNAGQIFMTDLLVNSLIDDHGLELALETAITERKPSQAAHLAIPILPLVKQLLRCISVQTQTHLQIYYSSTDRLVITSSGTLSSMNFLLRFQRLLLANFFVDDRIHVPSNIDGVNALLMKYFVDVCTYAQQTLQLANDIITNNNKNHLTILKILKGDVVDVLLPELITSLIVIQSELDTPIMTGCDWTRVAIDLQESLDKFNSHLPNVGSIDTDDLGWPDIIMASMRPSPPKLNDDLPLIRAADLHNHNLDGGLWIVINDKVYDVQDISRNGDACPFELLQKYGGRDASQVFYAIPHTLYAIQLMNNCLVGNFAQTDNEHFLVTCDDSNTGCSTLLDTQRALSHFLGMRALRLRQSLAVQACEIDCEKWIKSKILRGGLLTIDAFNPFEEKSDARTTNSSDSTPTSEMKTLSNADTIDNFILALAESRVHNALAIAFLAMVDQYFVEKKYLVYMRLSTEHPISDVSRMLLAVLIKHLALGHCAVQTVHDYMTDPKTTMPPELCYAMETVYKTKWSLVKMRQEQNRSFKEVCSPVLDKCRFLLYEMRAAVSTRVIAYHTTDTLYRAPRFKTIVRKVIRDLRMSKLGMAKHGADKPDDLLNATIQQSCYQNARTTKTNDDLNHKSDNDDNDDNESKHIQNEKLPGNVFAKINNNKKLTRKHGVCVDKISEIEWRRMMAFATDDIAREAAEFVLETQLDCDVLRRAMHCQHERYTSRQTGLELIIGLVNRDYMITSSKYAMLNGYMGLTCAKMLEQSAVHCLDNLHLISAARKNHILQLQARVNQWCIQSLRGSLLRNAKIKSNQQSLSKLGSNNNLSFLREIPRSRFLLAVFGILSFNRYNTNELCCLIRYNLLNSLLTLLKQLGYDHRDNSMRILYNTDIYNVVHERIDNAKPKYPLLYSDIESYLTVGSKVVRGPDWKWHDQDHNSLGTIVAPLGPDKWIKVDWSKGLSNSYRVGADGKYDLVPGPIENIPWDDDDDDDKLEDESVSKEAEVEVVKKHPNKYLKMMSVNLLKILSLSVGQVDELPSGKLSTINCLTGLQRQIITTANAQKYNTAVEWAKMHHDEWCSISLIRSIAQSDALKANFCTSAFMHVLLSIVKQNPNNSDVKLARQIEAIRLLAVLMPHWNPAPHALFEFIDELMKVLGNVLITLQYDNHCVYDNNKYVTVTQTYSGTVAHEIAKMVRSLQTAACQSAALINDYIVDHLKVSAEIVCGCLPLSDGKSSTESALELTDEIMERVMACLAVLGEADPRPRLGSRVRLKLTNKIGTIISMSKRGKMTILEHATISTMKLKELERGMLLCDTQFNLNDIPVDENVINAWAALLLIENRAGAERNAPRRINVAYLRQQQHMLGCLKVIAKLTDFRMQLRKILSCTQVSLDHSDDSSQNNVSLFHKILSKAVQLNPLQPIFTLDEILEAATVVSEHLASESNRLALNVSQVTAVKRPHAVIGSVEKNAKNIAKQEASISETTDQIGPPLPSSIVTQLLEMGFSKDNVHNAIKELSITQDTLNPDNLVAWLVEHTADKSPQSDESVASSLMVDDYESSQSDTEDIPATTNDPHNKRLTFLQRSDFLTDDEYAFYVRDNVSIAMLVRCCKTFEGVSVGDIGKVVKVDREALHDLNVQVEWQYKGSSYWVRFIHVELLGYPPSLPSPPQIKVGDKVRVKPSVAVPKYKWGLIDHDCVGVVSAVSANTKDVTVNFDKQSNWTGLIAEMEIVPSRHEGCVCCSCQQNPITGPRFTCKTCKSYHLCENCFYTKKSHKHAFNRIVEQGTPGVFAGKPGRYHKQDLGGPDQSTLISDWSSCVKKLSASSRETWMHTLIDGSSGYWLSCGTQGRHWLRFEMHPNILIHSLHMAVDPHDSSYMPSLVVVSGGDCFAAMKELNVIDVRCTDVLITLLKDVKQHYRCVEIAIKKCRNGGVDCKVHGLSIVGKRQQTADVRQAPCFLASEWDEQHRALYTRNMTTDSNDCAVYAWGLNDKDQLGGMKGSKVKLPVYSDVLTQLQPTFIAGGSKSLFIVSKDGKLYACGEGTNGRLGLGHSNNVSHPKPIPFLSEYFIKKVAVHSGGKYAMALTMDGKVFSWGEGEDGKLGHGNRLSVDKPRLIDELKSKKIRDIACGSSHSAAITSMGELYTWGMGEYGRLGHGDNVTQLKPKLVEALRGHRIVQVACGSRDAQTLALSDQGLVFSWGDGDFGKLGRGGSEGCSIPHNIERLNEQRVVQIECGAQFSLALTKSGEVWTWGKGDYYRLGHGTDQHVRRPTVIDALKGKRIVQVAVGALHCLAVTDTGEVYAWGDNDHGQQGNASTEVNKKPSQVLGLDDVKVNRVACGSSHSIAWFSKFRHDQRDECEAVAFEHARDPLGAHLLQLYENEKEVETGGKKPRWRQPLTHCVMFLESSVAKQHALTHVLNAAHILLLRQVLVAALHNKPEQVSKIEESESVDEEDVMVSSTTSSKHSRMSDSALSVIALTLDSTDPLVPAHVATIDDFLSLIKVDDAQLLVDLLKLATFNRVTYDGDAMKIIAGALKSLYASREAIKHLLLERCVAELEDVHEQLEILEPKVTATVHESQHPYVKDLLLQGAAQFPYADSLTVTFDANCETQKTVCPLIIMDGEDRALAFKHGASSNWKTSLVVDGSEVRWLFTASGDRVFWGWKFHVEPEMNTTFMAGSDRTVLSKPRFSLVTDLLDCDAPPTDEKYRLVSAIASCATLKVLTCQQRIWALKFLNNLLFPDCDASELLNKKSSLLTGFYEFLDVLPQMIRVQYAYEYPLVRTCAQLMYSNYFKILVDLACQCNLDDMHDFSDKDMAWFKNYCVANRMAKSLITRATLPVTYAINVRKTIVDMCGRAENIHELPCYSDIEDTTVLWPHEDHKIFTKKEDTQLLNWLHRKSEDWYLSLNDRGRMFAWGHNHRGQLAGLDSAKIKLPVQCTMYKNIKPAQIIGGEQTMFCVTTDGKVYANGLGSNGRLGIGPCEGISAPTLIEKLQHVFVKKVAVSSSGRHSLALTSDGQVYAWGEGEDGKLGLGNTTTHNVPMLITALKDQEIVDIACGGTHSAAINAAGNLFTWGKGRYGRLGHGDSESQYYPKMVETLLGHRVIDVACGSGDAQTLCITDDDNVWSWGDGDYGKLGRGGAECVKVPKKIETLTGLGVIKVECGSQFSVALTRSGCVYTWGKGDYHRLGHGSNEHVRRPKKVAGLQNYHIVAVVAGSLHCVAISDKGEIFTWGDNDEGQLGDGSVKACTTPKQIPSLKGMRITRIAGGSAHTLAWATSEASIIYLPKQVPLEYDLLRDIAIPVLYGRLTLLQHFSETIDSVLNMFPIEGRFSVAKLRGNIVTFFKENLFKKVIVRTMVRPSSGEFGPTVELDRITAKRERKHGQLAGPDGIRSVFGQMVSNLHMLTQQHLLLHSRVWKVKFIGEYVEDCGGAYQESIAEMCDELQNGSVPLLIVTPNGREDCGTNRDCFLLNPEAKTMLHMNMFRFLGVLIGIAIRTGSPLNLLLAEPVWNQLAGMELTASDISEFDRDYVPGLICVRDMDENDPFFTSMDTPFATTSASGKQVRLSDKHERITAQNRHEYVRLAMNFRLHEFDEQVRAVRDGMSKVIPLPLLSLFSGFELEDMACGSRDIDINMLKTVAIIRGDISPTDILITWFWEVLEEFTPRERALFLRFVSGRVRLPRTLADFRGRDFQIQGMPPDRPSNENFLPESFTCFFMLKLPIYPTKAMLKEKLTYAIYFCNSMDYDDLDRYPRTTNLDAAPRANELPEAYSDSDSDLESDNRITQGNA